MRVSVPVGIANIPAILSKLGDKGRLENVYVYGKLEEWYDGKPAWLKNVELPSGLKLGLVRVFLARFTDSEALKADLNPENSYHYIKGRLLIALPVRQWLELKDEWVTVGGYLGTRGNKPYHTGMTIKHQKYGDWNSVYNIGGLVFSKGVSGGWELRANYIYKGLYIPNDPEGNPAKVYIGFDFPNHQSVKAFDGLDKDNSLPVGTYDINTSGEPTNKELRVLDETPPSDIPVHLVNKPFTRYPLNDKLVADFLKLYESVYTKKYDIPLIPQPQIDVYELLRGASPEYVTQLQKAYTEQCKTQIRDLWDLPKDWVIERWLGSSWSIDSNWSFKKAYLMAMLTDFPQDLLNDLATLEGYYNSPDRGTVVSRFDFPKPEKIKIPEPMMHLPRPEVHPTPPEQCDLLVKLPSGYCSVSQYRVELEMFNNLIALGDQASGITEETVASVRADFEGRKGFSLSDEQADGVALTRFCAGVLSGCAGSGKTTTSDCMTEVLEAGGWEVLYACPTGKAAKRLSEVVGREVKTIHSFFRVPVGTRLPIFLEDTSQLTMGDINIPNRTALIFDEMAMCDTVLMASALSKAVSSTNDLCVFFLGDIKQLPPIGSGMPFRDLMNLLPTVELGVSRRAAAGSLVNYNCNVLNNCSPVEGTRDIYAFKGDDKFQMVSCLDEEIVGTIIQKIEEYIGAGIPRDDIQVVSPYVSPTRPWGGKVLNPKLQGILNPEGEILFVAGGQEFRKGDRVIHTRNNPDLVKLVDDRGVLVPSEETGIVNGEVGSLVGYLRGDDLRVASLNLGEQLALVESADGFYVYPGRVGRGGYFFSDDWEDIDLAYCISVHKSQGSQYKCVIFPLGSSDNPRFVNRNMIYTAISRSQERVLMVGDLTHLNDLRLEKVDGSDCHTVLEYLGGYFGKYKA